MDAGPCNGPTSGRSISTTRSIYMGRTFIRENLVKRATKSSLFNRDNYQFLVKKGWSLSACEQVLQKHQHARGAQNSSAVMSALIQQCRSATSLADLHRIIADHSHTMNAVTRSVVIQQVPRVILTRHGNADYAGAAVLLDQMAQQLPSELHALTGPNIAQNLSAFARCRYSPSGDLLQALCQELLSRGGAKLRHMQLPSLSNLMSALVKLVQPEGNGPLLQTILQDLPRRLQELIEQQKEEEAQAGQAAGRLKGHMQILEQQQQEDAAATAQQQEADMQEAAAAAAGRGAGAGRAAAAAGQQYDGTMARSNSSRRSYSVAYLAFCLDKQGLQSPEYLSALHRWVAQPGSLQELSPQGLVQLWSAFRGQFTKRHSTGKGGLDGDDIAVSSSNTATAGAVAATSSSSGSGDAGEVELLAADGDAAAAREAAAAADAAAAAAAGAASSGKGVQSSLDEQQQELQQFFGPGTLQTLAAATARRVSGMSERELGQLLFYMAALRVYDAELLAAGVAAVRRLQALAPLSAPTALAAAQAAVQLGHLRSELLQPALLAAVTQPGVFDGVMVGRLLKVTAALPPEVIREQQQLLQGELHRLSDRRGPAPALENAGNPAWVTALADDVSTRLPDLKPREIAHILHSFAAIPGVMLHEELFGGAARHIEAHAHMFTKFLDMEMVANAFERMNYKEGLPALKALQQQTQHLE